MRSFASSPLMWQDYEMVLRQQLLSTHRQEQLFQTFGNDLAVAIGQQIEAALRSREDALPLGL